VGRESQGSGEDLRRKRAEHGARKNLRVQGGKERGFREIREQITRGKIIHAGLLASKQRRLFREKEGTNHSGWRRLERTW